MKELGSKSFLKSIWTIKSERGEFVIFVAKTIKYIWDIREGLIHISKMSIGVWWIYEDRFNIKIGLSQDEVFEIIKEDYNERYKEENIKEYF